ncbi:hypothetical protein K474DRAFT_1656702 [Panus rudis PR-1116 ss-1]|nr:hypothetical protein K474DRAFT_1656702 [Panus rudis PR-1116 ss-1]
MILEIFLLGLLVFILGPILYLVWNIVLLCLGRHPVQRPHHINPEVGKLSKSVVDQIPLVLYIPAPPEGETDSNGKPITIPPEAYSYPPKQQSPAPRKRRFVFLRRSKKSKKDHNSLTTGDKKDNGKSDDDGPKKWEDNWEHGEYPFVVLEGNRAACAICLMDFEEPKRTQQSEENKDKPQTHVEDEKKDSESPVNGGEVNAEAGAAGDIVEEARPTTTVREDLARLMLEDAGEGPQPLRLLPCGHVFHQTCVDPWLTDVSGRCPVCQRPVDLKKLDGGRRSDPSRRENER